MQWIGQICQSIQATAIIVLYDISIILWSYAMASTMKRPIQSILGYVQVVTPMTRTLH